MTLRTSPGHVVAFVLIVVTLVGFLTWVATWDPFGSKRRLEQRAVTAERQVKNDTATIQAVDRYTHDVTIIREKTDVAVRQVQQAPGAETPIDPERRSILCSALARVRGSDACSGPDDPAKPPGAL